MGIVFLFSVLAGLVTFVIGLARLTLTNVMALYKHDGKTAYRRKKDKSVAKTFALAAAFIALAAATQFA